MNKTITAPDRSGELLRAGQVLTVTGNALVESINSSGIKQVQERVDGLKTIGPFSNDAQLIISAISGNVSYRDKQDTDDLASSRLSLKSNVNLNLTDTASDITELNTAIADLNASGGGIINLSEGVLNIFDTPITPMSGITIIGATPKLTLTGDAPDLSFTVDGGTVLTGDGTNTAIRGNKTDLAVKPTPGAANGITNFNLYNLAFYNFLYGIDIGAKNQIGLAFCRLENLFFKKMENTAIRLYNAQHIHADTIKIFDSAVKGIHLLNAHDSAACGNSVWIDPYIYPRYAAVAAEGIVLETVSTVAAGPSLNQITFLRPQVNAFGRTNKTGGAHVRLSGVADSKISNIKFDWLDAEGQADIVIDQSHTAQCRFNVSQTPSMAAVNFHAKSVNAAASFETTSGDFVTNFDANSSGSVINGQRKLTGMAGRQGCGLQFLPEKGTFALGMAFNGTDLTKIQGLVYSLRGFISPTTPIGQAVFTRDSTITLSGSQSGVVVFNGSAGQTFTLPTLQDTDFVNTDMGINFIIMNVSGNSLTVATNGTQLLNNQATKTSITLAPGQSAILFGAKTNGGSLFWALPYTNGIW